MMEVKILNKYRLGCDQRGHKWRYVFKDNENRTSTRLGKFYLDIYFTDEFMQSDDRLPLMDTCALFAGHHWLRKKLEEMSNVPKS